VKKRCDGPIGRLRQGNRKNHATPVGGLKSLNLLSKIIDFAKMTRSIAYFLNRKNVCFHGSLYNL
jgi:hypothetical protein